MPLPRYEREIEESAGPQFRRLFLIALCTAVFLGLGLGLLWVAAGLLHFHPLG
jgi:hypothetical protein